MQHRTTALAVLVTAAAAAATAGLLRAPVATAAVDAQISPDVRVSTVTRDGLTVKRIRGEEPKKRMTGRGATRADFDGDGVDDISTYATVDPLPPYTANLAVVVVRYSSTPASDLLTPADFYNSEFGRSIATGNFDGDRFDDLVIGAAAEAPATPPGTTPPLMPDNPAGGVWIVPGSSSGLNLARTVHITQDTPGIPGESEREDWFGWALATGDLTGDGLDDLAIGAPEENGSGAVTVLRGSRTGVTTSGATVLHQNLGWIPGTSRQSDRFGQALAIGRVDRDARADLVIGAPGDGLSGTITLVRGAAGGVARSGATSLTAEQVNDADGPTRSYGGFGGDNLTIADTTGDGLGEVIVGVPRTTTQTQNGFLELGGAVVVLSGRPNGLSTRGMRVIDQNTPGVPGVGANGDRFGSSVAAGDVTGDRRADILIGIYNDRIGAIRGAGSVVLLRGSTTGVSGKGSQAWSQAAPAVPGAAEKYDFFGGTVALLNLDGRGGFDAAVSAPNEHLSPDPNTRRVGTITTFTGGPKGLTPRQSWSGAQFRVPGIMLMNFGQGLGDNQSEFV